MKDEKENIKQGDKVEPTADAKAAESLAHDDAGHQSPLTLDLSRERWDKEFKHNGGKMVSDTPQGRLAIRAFSRGILGAAFYTWGWRFASDRMATYSPHELPENELQHVAKFIDKYVGKPIEMTVNFFGGDGKRAVTFRPTRKYKGWEFNGRSLGPEMIAVTFDFAAMSIGDAVGRDLALLVDPNARHQWEKEDGSIDVPKAIKALGTNMFRYFSYNAGEDLAVALPYVYYMKGQRALLSHYFPGFEYDFDRNLNGGSMKIDKEGRVVGNYMLPGLLDLQGRFTAYNIGTLMFREAYTSAAYNLQAWAKDGYKIPSIDLNPAHLVDKAGDIAKWGIRDAIKGTIYMTPAVPLFWMSRTPQTKYKGLFINPEMGPVGFVSNQNPYRVDLVRANEWKRSANKSELRPLPFNSETKVHFSTYNDHTHEWTNPVPANNPIPKKGFDPFKDSFGTGDYVLNKFGRVNNDFRKSLHYPGEFIEQHFFPGMVTDAARWKRLTDTFANASMAYTPYFWAKTEFANLWDNARMDMAIERTMDGVGKFDGKDFRGGLSELWQTLRLEPFKDEKREAEAREAVKNDISPADIFDPQIFQNYERVTDRYDPTRTLVEEEGVWHPFGRHSAGPPSQYTALSKDGHEQSAGSAVETPEVPLPEVKKSFVERLQRHKKDAQDRMDEFKGEGEKKSFAETVSEEKHAAHAPAHEHDKDSDEKKSFAEQHIARKHGDGPDLPPGTTIH